MNIRLLIITVVVAANIFQFQSLKGQNADEPSLRIAGKRIGDTIRVRWAPMDRNLWRIANEQGYIIQRKVLNRDTSVVDFHTYPPIFPLPENDWEALIEEDEFAGAAFHLLYEEDLTNYVGPIGAFEQERNETNRFGFALFTADVSFDNALRMGLGFADVEFDQDYIYSYQVAVNNGNELVLSDPVYIDPLAPDQLPVISQLRGEFGDHTYSLLWERGYLDNAYTAYQIDYKEKNELTYKRANDYPFLPMVPELLDEDQQPTDIIAYQDSLIQNLVDYDFRVRGISFLGELGPPSNVVTGQGKPAPLPVFPFINNIEQTATNTFRIGWRINEAFGNTVKGFNIQVARDTNMNFELLNSTLLPPTTRAF